MQVDWQLRNLSGARSKKTKKKKTFIKLQRWEVSAGCSADFKVTLLQDVLLVDGSVL